VSPTVVQQHALPERIRAAWPLTPDYFDVFSVTVPGASKESPERWARVALEGASPVGRFLAWQVLCGLRLEKGPSAGHVAGWAIAGRGEDWIRIEAASWFMTATAVCLVEDARVSMALMIRYDKPAGRLVWTPVSALHRRLMPGLLRAAVSRMRRSAS
jgi:hypothetical protein